MKTFPQEHELTVPMYRWRTDPKCPTPACGNAVRIPGEFCSACEELQAKERARLRAAKQGQPCA
jgi:hypothetical protein